MDNNVSKNTFVCKSFNLDVTRGNLAIKKLLKEHICESIQLYLRYIELNAEFDLIKDLITDKIVLCDLGKISSLDFVYRCSIAFPLGNYCHLSPLTVAQNLREFLPTTDVIWTTQPLLKFKVQVVSPGWIDFYMSDRALAVWLGELVGWVSQDSANKGDHRDENGLENFFVIQYAHARCCSLLRLGHQEKLIKIKHEYSGWEIVEPITLSWLNARGIFFLVHPVEKRLLIQLLIVVEELITNSQKVNWAKSAHNLSKVFLDFWTECRIYSEVKTEAPELAQARLELVALVQYFLSKLLQEKLYVSPLTEI